MLKNKVVVVTGGTRGIGKGLVELLLKEEAKVVVLAKTDESIAALNDELRDKGKFFSYKCNVASAAEVTEVFANIGEHIGRIDTLVNNAGVGVFKPVEEMTEEDWDVQLDINLKGAFLCSQAGYRAMMKSGGGQIVNVASDLAYNTREKASAYCASKWGLLGLSQTMNKEGRAHGIRVMTVSPGLVQTDFAGVSAEKKTSGLTVETVAHQLLSAIKAGKDAGEVEIIIRP